MNNGQLKLIKPLYVALMLSGMAQFAHAADLPPSISGKPPATATVGVPYRFEPVARDPEGKQLNFVIGNRPSWASFSYGGTGGLYGTPTKPGVHKDIRIYAKDGTHTVALPPFTITVQPATTPPVNAPPVIQVLPPPVVRAGEAYSFTPVASDPDRDILTFSIANKPSWATFNTSTGALSGTPSAAHVGTYTRIGILVSDGKATATIPEFGITVLAPASVIGSATLKWQAPTKNTDGSVLTNLAGYRVLYGPSPTALTRTIEIKNAAVTTYVVDQLPPGPWYFAVRAYTTDAMESELSNTASKVIG